MPVTLLYHFLGVRGYGLVKEKIVSGGDGFEKWPRDFRRQRQRWRDALAAISTSRNIGEWATELSKGFVKGGISSW